MGEGRSILGQLDANVVALDMKTGKEAWKTPIEDWQNGYGVTSAPLYYDGIIYSGITGGEFGVRGRLTALDAKTGEDHVALVHASRPRRDRAARPGRPAPTTRCAAALRSGTRRRSIPNSGFFISPSAIAARTTTARCVKATTCSAPRSWRIEAKTGDYAWHFQEVHHDIWDYDAASPVVLFDTTSTASRARASPQAGRTGWVYILDRTNGKPLIGIEEKPVPQEPRQKTAATQPIPVGDPTVPQCAEQLPGYDEAGCIFDAVLGNPGSGPAFGGRRHQLVADAV